MPHGSSPSPANAAFSAVPITSAPFVSGSGFVRRRDVFPSLPLLPRSSTPLLAPPSSSLLLTSSTAFHDWVAASPNDAAAQVKVGDDYGNREMVLFGAFPPSDS